jgi:hypothetical protein
MNERGMATIAAATTHVVKKLRASLLKKPVRIIVRPVITSLSMVL